jgi:uncharacterized RDD family membrane protein YckC
MGRVGFWWRTAAAVIDVLNVALVCGVLGQFLDLTPRMLELLFASAWLIYTLAEVYAEGTPGKRFLRMKIARADGRRADKWTLFLRWYTKQFPAICGLLFLMSGYPPFRILGGFESLLVTMGFLYASTEFKQAWHDQWAQTAVYPTQVVTARTPPARGSAAKD